MSNTNNEQPSQSSVNDATTISDEAQLETLKKRADLIGLSYHPNIGVTTLTAKIEAKLAGEDETKSKTVSKAPEQKEAAPKYTGEMLTAAEFKILNVRKRRQNAGALIRIRLVCMNPTKKEWPGELFSVGSAKMGTFKKFVPFDGNDSGYHVPQMMLDMIRERKCAHFFTTKGPKGNKIRKAKLVPEFSIEELPPLTKDELKDLAKQQAMSGSLIQE